MTLPAASVASVEMFLKVVALGFVVDKHSYLRNHWNKLDFFVVVCGYINFLPGVPINSSALRSVRLLRPLRAFEFFDGMRVRAYCRGHPPPPTPPSSGRPA